MNLLQLPPRGPQYAYDKILCPCCKGDGYTTTREMTCYHRGEYDVLFHACTVCDTRGILKRTITTTYEKLPALPAMSEGAT